MCALQFAIRHYAATVTYDANGFCSKNKDPVQVRPPSAYAPECYDMSGTDLATGAMQPALVTVMSSGNALL